MNYFIIPLVAFGASLLTFFSGFGLGTLLTPVFVIFFPIEIAIALTAIVHFLNGLFKLVLVGKNASREVVIKFGLPAIFAALLGAFTLSQVSHVPHVYSYQLFGYDFHILPLKVLMAILIISFTLFEFIPRLKNLQINSRYLSVGGILSGFFGGLSGHQGALRSVFLARAGLNKEQFVATATVIANLIDGARLAVYSKQMASTPVVQNLPLLLVTTLGAFLGAYFGNSLLKKITLESLQMIVSICLILLALALGLGMI